MKRLKQSIAKQLLSSEKLLGTLADKFGVTGGAVRIAIERDAKYLVADIYQNAIREVLGLPADEEITEVYTPEIIHE